MGLLFKPIVPCLWFRQVESVVETKGNPSYDSSAESCSRLNHLISSKGASAAVSLSCPNRLSAPGVEGPSSFLLRFDEAHNKSKGRRTNDSATRKCNGLWRGLLARVVCIKNAVCVTNKISNKNYSTFKRVTFNWVSWVVHLGL